MNVKQATGRNKLKRLVLNPDIVTKLRTDWVKGGLTYQQLADKYEIHYETARLCATGKTWANVV